MVLHISKHRCIKIKNNIRLVFYCNNYQIGGLSYLWLVFAWPDAADEEEEDEEGVEKEDVGRKAIELFKLVKKLKVSLR